MSCTKLIWGPFMEVQLQPIREAWLNYIAERMAPVFENLGALLPAQLRIAIGFTSQRPAPPSDR
jgi:hypothetical protein